MSNLTYTVNDLLKRRNAGPLGSNSYSIDQLNEFLKEAYQVNKRVAELLNYLKSIRQPYLSTAPPPRRRHHEQNDAQGSQYLTDIQRDQIDAEAKGVLRDLHAAVTNLSRAEQIRQETDTAIAQKRKRRNGFGALGNWALGGATTAKGPEEQAEEAQKAGVKAHREGVIWFLQRRLEHCGGVQSSMMEIRLKREVEKSKSVLYKTRGSGPIPVWEDPAQLSGTASGQTKKQSSKKTGVPYPEFEKEMASSGASEEQMQLFAQENEDLIKQYENKIDQVRTAEKSLLEISELQSTLATNLDIQSAHIDQLIQDSYNTTENVDTGNKELKKASERRSTARMIFYATAGICSFFVLWDFVI